MNKLDHCYLEALSEALKGNLGEALELRNEADALASEGFSFSEDYGSKYPFIEEAVNTLLDSYEFTRCVRADGTAYGTRGKCKKGTEGGPAPTNNRAGLARPAKESKIKEENYSWGRLIMASNDFASNKAILHPEHQAQIHKLKDGGKTSFEDEQRVKWNAERKGDHIHLTSPRRGQQPIIIAHSRLGTGARA